MQIVIDIPEELYKANHRGLEAEELWDLRIAIKNGIPLPKWHGKIIDYGYVVDAIDDWVNAEEYRYTNATDYLRKRVLNTPIIIEEVVNEQYHKKTWNKDQALQRKRMDSYGRAGRMVRRGI